METLSGLEIAAAAAASRTASRRRLRGRGNTARRTTSPLVMLGDSSLVGDVCRLISRLVS